MIYHAGTGTYFGLDDGVLLIDTDTLTDEQRWEMSESGEMSDTANGVMLGDIIDWPQFERMSEPQPDYSDYPQNEDEAKTCRHGNLYWFGNVSERVGQAAYNALWRRYPECGICNEEGLDNEVCLVCGQPDNCGDCDHTPVPPEAYGE